MGISNNYARRANYNTDSEDSLKNVTRSTFCYHEKFSPKKSIDYLHKTTKKIIISKKRLTS